MATTPIPPSLVKAWATLGLKNTIPVAPTATPGQASFDLGFPPITMPNPGDTGMPPDGKDMNGILHALSAHVAWIQAGGCYPFNAAVISIVGGYKLGAVLQSAVTPTLFFINQADGNANNPDSVVTGWLPYNPASGVIGLQTTVLVPGTTSDLALARGAGFLDLNPTTGAATLTGVAATNVTDGQPLTITNINGFNPVTLKSLDVSSGATARFRLATDITLLQYSGITLRHSSAIGLWVPST